MRSGMRVLIVAPAWIGDMVMTDTLVRLLRAQNDAVEIHMLAPPATQAVAKKLEGISAVHVLDTGHGEIGLAKRWRVAAELRETRFDQAIVLPNSLKSALVPWLAGIPERTGWLGEQRRGLLNDWRRLDETKYPLQIERFMALGLAADQPIPRPYPLPVLRVDGGNARAVADSLGLDTTRPVTVLCPGAEFGPAKRWPAAHYATVARHITAAGGQVWLMGSDKDADVCSEIIEAARSEAVHALAGRTRLADAIDLMSLSTRVITNDSGLMHVAAALGLPLTAIYGSTSPDFTPPLSDHADIRRLGLPCSPCFQRTCPLGHLDCLHKLSPEQVINTP